MQAWPTVTFRPIRHGRVPAATWRIEPSWMLVPEPIRIAFVSPRSTQCHHTLAPAPISTSPMTLAVGATQASEAMRGVTPSSVHSGPSMGKRWLLIDVLAGGGWRVQAEHQPQVLHCGARCAFAEVVEPGHQHRVAMGWAGVDA